MKKIFILGILIAPIVANAGPSTELHVVGPEQASGTPVIATRDAPYATATVEDGDAIQVVSASYVKGAYNDTIAAVNRVNKDMSVKRVNALATWGSNTVTKIPLVNQY